MRAQQHIDAYEAKNGHGTLCEWVEVHTYDDPQHVYVTAHGQDGNYDERSIDFLWTEEEARKVRDALNQILDD